jgi:hypothetical protein
MEMGNHHWTKTVQTVGCSSPIPIKTSLMNPWDQQDLISVLRLNRSNNPIDQVALLSFVSLFFCHSSFFEEKNICFACLFVCLFVCTHMQTNFCFFCVVQRQIRLTVVQCSQRQVLRNSAGVDECQWLDFASAAQLGNSGSHHFFLFLFFVYTLPNSNITTLLIY